MLLRQPSPLAPMTSTNCQPATGRRRPWEDYKLKIRQLYEVERKTLAQVKFILESQYEFPITPLSTYETKLRDLLGMRKKLKRSDWLVIYQHCQQRESEGKKSAVYIHGVEVPWKKAWKEIRRSGALSVTLPDQIQPLRPGVEVRTRPSRVPSSGSTHSTSHLHSNDKFALVRQGRICPPTTSPLWLHFPTIFCDDRPTDTSFEKLFVGDEVTLDPRKVFGCEQLFPYTKPDSSLHLSSLPLNRFMAGRSRGPLGHSLWPCTDSFQAMDQSGLSQSAPLTIELWQHFSTAVSVNFDTYTILRSIIFHFSNNLHAKFREDDEIGYRLINVFFQQLPNGFVDRLLRMDFPTIRSAWEKLMQWSMNVGNREVFSFLTKTAHYHLAWLANHQDRLLICAAEMGLLDILKELLILGLPANSRAILGALEAGHEDCALFIVDHFYTGAGLHQPAIFGDCLLRGLADSPDCLSGLEHSIERGTNFAPSKSFWIGNRPRRALHCLKSFYRVLDRFQEHGASMDWALSGAWVKRPRLSLRHILQCFEELQCMPTLRDLVYCISPELYFRVAKQSSRSRSPPKPTHAGIFIAARQGEQALAEYIQTHPAPHIERVLECTLSLHIVAAEVIDLQMIQGLVGMGVDVNTPFLHAALAGLKTALWPVQSNRLVSILLYRSNDVIDHNVQTVVEYLLSHGAKADSEAICYAVTPEGLGCLPILARHETDFGTQGGEALVRAAQVNNFQAVSWLLEAGVDINSEVEGRSMLYRAYRAADTKMLAFLLHRGAKLQLRSTRSSIEFLCDFLKCHSRDDRVEDKLRLLLDSGIDLKTAAGSKDSILEASLRFLNLSTVAFELLLERGAPLSPGSPLAYLIFCGFRRELINKLLEAGASLGAYSLEDPNLTPLQAAGMRGDLELVKELLSRGAILNQKAGRCRGRTVLQAACELSFDSEEKRQQKVALVEFLLQQGADASAPPGPESGLTAMQAAAMAGDIDVVALLYDRGADINAPRSPRRGFCALDGAAFMGRLDVVQFLLSCGSLSDYRGRSSYDGAIRLAEITHQFTVAQLIRDHATKNEELFGMNSGPCIRERFSWKEFCDVGPMAGSLE